MDVQPDRALLQAMSPMPVPGYSPPVDNTRAVQMPPRQPQQPVYGGGPPMPYDPQYEPPRPQFEVMQMQMQPQQQPVFPPRDDLKTQFLMQQIAPPPPAATTTTTKKNKLDLVKKVAQNPLWLAAATGALVFLLLSWMNPPFVQQQRDGLVKRVRPNMSKVLLLSTVAGAAVFVIPTVITAATKRKK